VNQARRRHHALIAYLEGTSTSLDPARHIRVLSAEEESELACQRISESVATDTTEGQPGTTEDQPGARRP
jgi:hypothetical protein